MRKANDDPGRQPVQKALQISTWALSAALFCCFCFLIWHMMKLEMFSSAQLILAALIALILTALLGAGMIFTRKIVWKVLCILLSAALGVVCLVGGHYMNITNQALDLISGSGSSTASDDHSDILNQADLLTSKMAITVTTYAMTESGIQAPSDLNGYTVGVAESLDEQGTSGALKQLRSSGAGSFETVEYTDIYSLTDALYNNEVDAIVFPEQYHNELLDAANDYNKYNALTTFTNTVDQYIYYEDIPEELKNPADPVENIDEDPFIVLISGSDSYGTLNAKSRSDVNMLVAVNPKTYEVLILSLPRDTYMAFSCRKNETACGYAAGQMDKLTHSGIYGVGTTESSIEDFLDIEINYTVRVNFSSLINVVDAIGGIDVEVGEGLAVDTFYANGTEGVHEGINHLDGERALAFARERHAYLDGDNQRIRNQQIVMKALMKSMMSPSMIVNYPKFLRALSTAFTTNMPSSQIRSLIRLELSKFPSWNIQSYALTGNADTAYCAALGANASVSIVPEDQVEYAHQLFEDVANGDPIDLSDAPAVSGETGSVSNQSQDSTDQQTDNAWEYEEQIQIPSQSWNPPVYDNSWENPGWDDDEYATPEIPEPETPVQTQPSETEEPETPVEIPVDPTPSEDENDLNPVQQPVTEP